MKIHGFRAQKEPGVRLSIADLLMVATALAAWRWLASVPELEQVSPLPIHLIVTFLCFCNIFRIGTRAELAWVATLVLSWVGFSASDVAPYPAMLWTTVPAMVAVIVWSALRGRYNGIFHAAIERHLACSKLP